MDSADPLKRALWYFHTVDTERLNKKFKDQEIANRNFLHNVNNRFLMLPDIALYKIFNFLSWQDKLNFIIVCKKLHTPRIFDKPKRPYIMLCGGMLPKAVLLYDTYFRTWKNGPEMLSERHYKPFVVRHENKTYVGGGCDADGRSIKTMECLTDYEKEFVRLPDLPIPLSHTSACVANNLLIIVGGSQERVSAESVVAGYDIYTTKWKRSIDFPMRISNHCLLTNSEGVLFVIGGYNHDAITRLDWRENNWTTIATLPTRFVNSAACVLRDRYLFVTGGDISNGITRMSQKYSSANGLFDLRMNKWTDFADLPYGRSRHNMICLPLSNSDSKRVVAMISGSRTTNAISIDSDQFSSPESHEIQYEPVDTIINWQTSCAPLEWKTLRSAMYVPVHTAMSCCVYIDPYEDTTLEDIQESVIQVNETTQPTDTTTQPVDETTHS